MIWQTGSKNWASRLACAALLLLLCMRSHAADTNTLSMSVTPNPPAKDYTLQWALESQGFHEQDALSNQSTEYLLGVQLIFDLKVNSWISANLSPEIFAQTGFVQAPTPVDPQTSRVDIKNASLDLLPIQYFKFSIGSLNEEMNGELHSRIFMRNLSFPAARAIVQSSNQGPWKLSAYYEAAIPTSSSFSDNTNDLNSTPTLNTAGLGFDLGSDRTALESHTHASYYQFDNLPTSIQTASALLGNSAVASSGTDYALKYQFAGYEAFTDWRWRFTRRWEVRGFAMAVDNPQATSDTNFGYDAGFAVGYYWNKNLEIIPQYEYFNIGADATVSAYNWDLFGTNVGGDIAGLKFVYKHHYKIEIDYENKVPLIENPSQPADQVVWIYFGASKLSF